MFCKKIEPFAVYYRKLLNSCNKATHNILGKEIKLLLPLLERKQKCGIITTLVSSFIGLAYEGYPVSFIINEIIPYTKLLMPWMVRLISSTIN